MAIALMIVGIISGSIAATTAYHITGSLIITMAAYVFVGSAIAILLPVLVLLVHDKEHVELQEELLRMGQDRERDCVARPIVNSGKGDVSGEVISIRSGTSVRKFQ